MTRSGFVAMIVGSGLAVGQLAALPAAADDTAARRQALEPYFRNYRASGAGPFPAILMVSGCGGFTPSIAQERQRAGDRKDMSWSLSITSRHAGCPTAAVRAR